MRAGSRGVVVGEEEEGEGEGGEKWLGARTLVVEAAATSRPVVKARGPAPERMMARVWGQVERWVKMRGSSSHILMGGEGLAGGFVGGKGWEVGGLRLYEGFEFLRAVDLDVGDVGVGVGEVEVFVGWGWGLLLCHCGRGGGLYVGLCRVGRNNCWYRALHVIYQGETDWEVVLVCLCLERRLKKR